MTRLTAPLCSLLLFLLSGPLAWAQQGTDTAPTLPDPAPRDSGRLVLEPLDSGRYRLSVLASDGQLYRCAAASQDEPCTLSGLPTGKLTLRVSGDARYEQTLNLGQESVFLRVDGHNPWYGWLAVGGLSAGFLSSTVAVTTIGYSDGFNGLTLLAFAATPILYTVGLIYGVLWLLDKDEVTVDRFDVSASVPALGEHGLARAGLLPGGALGLELRW